MLACEESILDALNEAGSTATREALLWCDTDVSRASSSVVSCGFPRVDSPSTTRRRAARLRFERHVYQRSHGGKTSRYHWSVMGASW